VTKKPKFQPVITRVKLNPEQAVLQCSCYQGKRAIAGAGSDGMTIGGGYCDPEGGKLGYAYVPGGGTWKIDVETAAS